MSRHSARSSSRAPRRFPRWLKITVLATLVLANVAVFGLLSTIRTAETAFREYATQLDDVVPELAVRPMAAKDPLFFLIIGSDSRQGVDTAQFGDFAGARGDVVMMARVDPGAGKAQLLSIPRDTLVAIEGYGEEKINAAFAHGGAPLMVKTVRQAFDVPIHHYVEVDFVGFQALVDEIGGVEMTFINAARDPKSHLDVPAGKVSLDGFQALAYARSRSYQELQDGAWRSVDASDIGRSQRQQRLVLAILSHLKRPATLADTGDIVGSFAQHLTVDAALANSSLVQLAFAMRSVGPADIETAILPTVGSTHNRASVQLVDSPGAEAVLDAFRSGRPMDTEKTADIVNVHVLNGNGVAGSGGRWAELLESEGYTVVSVANAGERRTTTAVVVDAAHVGAAGPLVEALGFGESVIGTVTRGADAVVILGSDAETKS